MTLLVAAGMALFPPAAYAVNAPATMVISPDTLRPGATFQGTLTVALPQPCQPGRVVFSEHTYVSWNEWFAPPMSMPPSCTATETLTVPPEFDSAGSFPIIGIYDVGGVRYLAAGRFTVIVGGTPSPQSSPTPTASAHPSARKTPALSALASTAAARPSTSGPLGPTSTEPEPLAVTSDLPDPALTERSASDRNSDSLRPWWYGLAAGLVIIAVGAVVVGRARRR